MHSGVFAVSPAAAGRTVCAFLRNNWRPTIMAEVLDVDEDLLSSGLLSPRLCGTMRVPAARELVQTPKMRSAPSEADDLVATARGILAEMRDDITYVVGPGTTTGALLSELGIERGPLAVDVVRAGALIASDVSDRELVGIVGSVPAAIIVAPVGGQGFIFGRGNQQIIPDLIDRVFPGGLLIGATNTKLANLHGRPLMVDTGDLRTDARLASAAYARVILSANAIAWYPLASAADSGA
jgi:predicted polyphosphate/ATP-dependent NAD kinase